MPAGRKTIFGATFLQFCAAPQLASALKKKRVWSMRAENVYQW